MGLPLLLYNFDLANVLSKSLLLLTTIADSFHFTTLLVHSCSYSNYLHCPGRNMDPDFLCYIPTDCGSVLLFLMLHYVRSLRGEDGHLYIPQVVKSDDKKIYKPPPRFLNSDSNIRNSFLILANSWLNLNLHCS